MPTILLVPVQMLMKLTQKPAKEISTCSQENTNKLEKVKIALYNMFSAERVCRKMLNELVFTLLTSSFSSTACVQ